jgi:2-succinyl-6-hydroxy-2,4-cyclohexadiene-1-carboxylate synthase
MCDGLFLLHGFTGSPASWKAVTAGMPARTRVLAPALVGHGSAANATGAGFEDEVDRLAALVSREATWHLAGYSLGGRIALGLLVRYPTLFRSATLVGAQPGLETERARAERRAADDRWCELLERRPYSEFVDEWSAQPIFRSQSALSDDVLAGQRRERLAHDPKGLVQSLRTTGLGAMPSYWPSLSGIGIAVSLVVGEYDDKFRDIADRMAAQMPRARVEVVAGAGHNILLERPDAVRAVLCRALDSEGAP